MEHRDVYGAVDGDVDTLGAVDTSAVVPDRTPVRWRRTVFVYVTVTASFVVATYLALKGTGDIGGKVAESLLSYATVTSTAYIFGHSIDRSEILTKIGASYGPTPTKE